MERIKLLFFAYWILYRAYKRTNSSIERNNGYNTDSTAPARTMTKTIAIAGMSLLNARTLTCLPHTRNVAQDTPVTS